MNNGWMNEIWLVVVPHAAWNFSIVTDAYEFVGRRHSVKVGRFLVREKGVRYPHVSQVLGTHRQDFDASLALERKTIVRPVLTKVNIQCKILEEEKNNKISIMKLQNVQFMIRDVSLWLLRTLKISRRKTKPSTAPSSAIIMRSGQSGVLPRR